MRRACSHVLLAVLLWLAPACTDWDAGSAIGPSINPLAPAPPAPVAPAGLVQVETWQPPAVQDAGSSAEVKAEAGAAEAGGADQGAGALPDQPDLEPPDLGGDNGRPGWPDGGGGDGPLFDLPLPDGPLPDTPWPDATSADGSKSDTPWPDAGPVDGLKPDSQWPDAAPADTPPVDSAWPELVPVDTVPSDSAWPDTAPFDGPITDSAWPDSPPGDLSDSGGEIVPADAGPQPDSAWPDWQGYPDPGFPPDVDPYKGAIGSCVDLYLYMQESCGFLPTPTCLDQAVALGSPWAQYRFAPMKACLNDYCLDWCKFSSDSKCLEQCLGKHCTAQFLSCLSNGDSGVKDCPSTFECLQSFQDKMFSIAAICYAKASPQAQKQLAAFLGCVSPPQTESCIGHVGTCYGPGSDYNCVQILNCWQKCPQSNGELCAFKCVGQGKPQAIKVLTAFLDCRIANCSYCQGNGACEDQCSQQHCQAETNACLAGG